MKALRGNQVNWKVPSLTSPRGQIPLIALGGLLNYPGNLINEKIYSVAFKPDCMEKILTRISSPQIKFIIMSTILAQDWIGDC